MGTTSPLPASNSMNHHSGPPDQDLISASVAGDREAFGVLVCRYQDRLFNSMARMLRCEMMAADVVQDAFLLAWRKLDSFAGRSAFYSWLFRIARNQAISKIRSSRPTVSLDGMGDGSMPDFAGNSESPDGRMVREESLMQLEQAMACLSEPHRAILILREIEEMDYEQISGVLELPVGTVRSRLFRARMQLRDEMLKLVETDD